MEKQVAIIEKEIVNIENILLNKASLVQNIDQFFEFYFSYLSNYFPILEFAIECLPENSIAKLGNFGMLIDHVTAVQLDRVLSHQNSITANQISERIKRPKSEILKVLNNITTAHKIQLSSQLIVSSSISRDLTLTAGTSKFSAINKIIAWTNILTNFLHFPVLIESMIDEELLHIAEKELTDAKTLIQKRDRRYDWGLASDWHDAVELSRLNIQETPKYFVGPKLAWLQAMEALELGKCILDKNIEAGKNALNYNEKIINLLKNNNISNNEWSYRTFNTSGPCCNLKAIIDNNCEGDISFTIVDSHTILFQSNKNRFFLTIPSNFNFYINPQMTIQLSDDLSIPISHDINAIVAFYKNPAIFFANNLKKLSTPEESFLLLKKEKDRIIIKALLKSFDSIQHKLAITYNHNINKPIASLVGKTCTTTFDGLLVYGLLFGFEGLAKSAGLPVNSELWSETRVAITGVLLSRISIIGEFIKKSGKEQDEDLREKGVQENVLISFEDKMRAFYKKIEDSHLEFTEAIEEVKDRGLLEIMDISNKIREIILSGLSMEEVKEGLDIFFESIRKENVISES